jgi:glycosyltransferase involved in cell wall biosynthesis
MRILWFSNTPAAGGEVLSGSGVRGGWLTSLNKALRGVTQLSIAFNYARYIEPFEYLGVMYYPICKRNWRVNIIRENLLGTFHDSDDLNEYLKLIDLVRPDVIHIHGTENPFGCIIGKTKIPVVVSFQGGCSVISHKFYSGVERKYGILSDVRLFKPRTWLFNKSYNYYFKRNIIKSALREQKNLSNCRYIIGRTDWDRRITRILAPQSIYFHNDELLRDIFYKVHWEKPKHPYLAIHSTLGDAPFKGLETICQAIYELKKINISVEWRIAGLSYNSLSNKMVRKKLGSLYPTNGIVFLGNLEEPELIKSLLEADIFVMPSHIENSPNSLCEAMILGIPTITTLAGGSSSLLQDKKEGIVIQDGDPWSMAGAILELSNNLDVALTYGKNARNTALNRHDPENTVKELLAIYDRICTDHK